MFTRLVECRPKIDKREDLSEKVRSEVLAILRRQPGFVDLIALCGDPNQGRLFYISFWNSRADAEHYHNDYYYRIVNLLRPLLESDPILETFQVDDLTVHSDHREEAGVDCPSGTQRGLGVAADIPALWLTNSK